MPPLAERVRINWPPYLFGADRAYAAVGFVKAKACFFEWQLAIIQKAAYFSFRVSHQVLVNDAMNPAWQYAVEMRHQRGIGSVIQPDIVQVIGRSLAEREDLLEVRNTA